MEVRGNLSYALKAVSIDGAPLRASSFPFDSYRFMCRSLKAGTADNQGKISVVLKGDEPEAGRMVAFARRVGWISGPKLNLKEAREVVAEEVRKQGRILPGFGLVGQGLFTTLQKVPNPITMIAAVAWAGVGVVRYVCQVVQAWRAHRRARQKADVRGVERAGGDLAVGTLYTVGSLDTVADALKSALHTGIEVAQRLADVANGLFGGGLVISLFRNVRDVTRYFSFRNELKVYLGNDRLSRKEQVYGALRMMLEGVSGEGSEAKVLGLKRRTSWEVASAVVKRGEALLADPLLFEEARALVERALRESTRKNVAHLATALFSAIAAAGYFMGAAHTGGLLAFAFGVGGVFALMAVSLVVHARDIARWVTRRFEWRRS